MKKNSCLYKSQIARKNNQSNDEFFTPYDAVKNELDNYRGHDLPSTARFGDKKYYFFDLYPDILNVDKIKDIPVDYTGKLGVPPTYIKYHDPSKYRIPGLLDDGYKATVNGKRKFLRAII